MKSKKQKVEYFDRGECTDKAREGLQYIADEGELKCG